METTAHSSSAQGTASHTPSTSSRTGRISSPASRKPKVRRKEMRAEVLPSPRAVKKAEEMFSDVIHDHQEKHRVSGY